MRAPIFLLTLVVGAVWGCDKPESTRLEVMPPPHVRVAQVRAVTPRPESRHWVPLTPSRRARLAPRSGGEVVELKVDEQENVREGQTLIRFAANDPRGGLISAKASITRIQENLRDNARELETAQTLIARGIENTRTLERLETERAVLEAQLRENQGNLVRAQDRIGATSILAPFRGTITTIETEVGEYLPPGSTAMVLAQLDPISVDVPLTQREVRLADAGGLEYEVRARGQTLKPELEWLASDATPGTSTFVARLKIPNPELRLRGGEFVEVFVYGVRRERVKAVPATAVRWLANQAYLLKIENGKTTKRVDVEVRQDAEELVVVEGAIQEGDVVVSSGPVTLGSGDDVEIVL